MVTITDSNTYVDLLREQIFRVFDTHTHHNGHANLPVALISQNTNVLHHHVIDLQCRECGSHTSEKVRKITLIEEVCTIALVGRDGARWRTLLCHLSRPGTARWQIGFGKGQLIIAGFSLGRNLP